MRNVCTYAWQIALDAFRFVGVLFSIVHIAVEKVPKIKCPVKPPPPPLPSSPRAKAKDEN